MEVAGFCDGGGGGSGEGSSGGSGGGGDIYSSWCVRLTAFLEECEL